MHLAQIVQWGTFTGAWLLVIGSLYQALLELKSENLELGRIQTVVADVAPPPRPSPWWWLVPPVHLVLARVRTRTHVRAVVAAIPDDDYSALMAYANKAIGWMFVAGGGLLLAIGENYSIIEAEDWPQGAFWVLTFAAVLGSVLVVSATHARNRRAAHARMHNGKPAVVRTGDGITRQSS